MLTQGPLPNHRKPRTNTAHSLRRTLPRPGMLSPMNRPAPPLTPKRWLEGALQGAPVDLCQQRIAPIAEGSGRPMYELLLRPSNGSEALDPETVVDWVERTGQAAALDHLVVRAAARYLGTNPGHTRFTINLTAGGVATAGHADALLAVLAEYAVPAARIIWEVGEARPLPATPEVLANLATWRDAGAGLALDDFGVCCANLHLAARFEFALLKLDRRFTREIFSAAAATRKRISVGLSSMAQAIGARLVFEGLETAADLNLARGLVDGPTWGQGYCIHRPEHITPPSNHRHDVPAILMGHPYD